MDVNSEPARASRPPLAAVLTGITLALVLALIYAYLASRSGRLLLDLDDGYIHARLAENLARTGVLGINPGEGGGGSSSLLWTVLLALSVKVGMSAEHTAFAFGFVSLVLAVLAAARLAFRLLPPSSAWAVTLLTALAGQQAVLALSGMEAVLFAAGIAFGFAELAAGKKRNATVIFALTALVRVEAVLAALAVAGTELHETWTRKRSVIPEEHSLRLFAPAITRLLMVFLAATAGVGLIALLAHGWPSTFAARRWLYGLGAAPFTFRGPAGRWLFGFFQDIVIQFTSEIGPGGWIGLFWALAVFELAITGVIRLFKNGGTGRALALYAGLQFLFVLLALGNKGHMGRYLQPVWLLMPVFVLMGWHVTRDSLPIRTARPLAWIAAILLLTGYFPQMRAWSVWYNGTVNHLRRVHLRMAEDVRRDVPANEPVAAFDIGLLSYLSGHRVVDISGLNGHHMVAAMYAQRVPALLDKQNVHYLVLPETEKPGTRFILARILGFNPRNLHPIAHTALPPDEMSHLAATHVAMPALTLYRF